MHIVAVEMADQLLFTGGCVAGVHLRRADIPDPHQGMIFKDLPADRPPVDPLGIGPPAGIEHVPHPPGKIAGLHQIKGEDEKGQRPDQFAVLHQQYEESRREKSHPRAAGRGQDQTAEDDHTGREHQEPASRLLQPHRKGGRRHRTHHGDAARGHGILDMAHPHGGIEKVGDDPPGRIEKNGGDKDDPESSELLLPGAVGRDQIDDGDEQQPLQIDHVLTQIGGKGAGEELGGDESDKSPLHTEPRPFRTLRIEDPAQPREDGDADGDLGERNGKGHGRRKNIEAPANDLHETAVEEKKVAHGCTSTAPNCMVYSR